MRGRGGQAFPGPRREAVALYLPPGPRAAQQAAGLTLVEVLVALAVAAVLLACVGSVLASARSAGAAEERALEPRLALDLAAELLAEEAGMAGHAPLSAEAGVPQPAVVLRRTLGGHALSVAFVDDRLAGPPAARDLRFEAGVDAQGRPQLYRASGSASRQPLVEGVTVLEVESVVDAAGELRAPAAGSAFPSARALVLRLEATGGEERVAVVALGARPTVAVAP